MKIYIIILCLIIILLKYRISKKKNINKNKMIKLFNITSLPLTLLILTMTFYEDCLRLMENKTQNVFSNVYTEPADF